MQKVDIRTLSFRFSCAETDFLKILFDVVGFKKPLGFSDFTFRVSTLSLLAAATAENSTHLPLEWREKADFRCNTSQEANVGTRKLLNETGFQLHKIVVFATDVPTVIQREQVDCNHNELRERNFETSAFATVATEHSSYKKFYYILVVPYHLVATYENALHLLEFNGVVVGSAFWNNRSLGSLALSRPVIESVLRSLDVNISPVPQTTAVYITMFVVLMAICLCVAVIAAKTFRKKKSDSPAQAKKPQWRVSSQPLYPTTGQAENALTAK